jgi:hypothetical protein
MLLLRDGGACIEVSMSLPDLHANPTKLMLADASHMDAAVVLVDRLLAHGTFLDHQSIDPLVILVSYYRVPVFDIKTIQRKVVTLSAYVANRSPTLALNISLTGIIYPNGFLTAFERA